MATLQSPLPQGNAFNPLAQRAGQLPSRAQNQRAALAPQVPLRATLQIDPIMLLAQEATELTAALSSRVQEKSLRDRRLVVGTRSGALSREQINEMLETMGVSAAEEEGLAESQVDKLGRQLLRQPGKAKRLAREQGGDASEQYLSLLEAADRLEEGLYGPDPGAQAQTQAREAAAELLAEYGPSIRADINSFDALRELPAEQAREFRSGYRDAVVGQATVLDTLRHLLSLVPTGEGADYSRVLDTLRQALGLDLAAARPSGDPVRLQALVDDLSHLKVISTVVDVCQQLSNTLRDRHGVAPFSATGLTAELVTLTGERWVDASRVGRLSENFGVHANLTAAVDFMSGTRNALRELPLQVFISSEARSSLLEVAQQALDEAIDREEGLI
jgi:type III secretion protein W